MLYGTTWMNLEIIILSEVIERQYHRRSLICVESNKNDKKKSLFTKQRQSQKILKQNLGLPKGNTGVKDKL